MKNKKLLHLLGDIDDKFIAEAEPSKAGPKSKKYKIYMAAASIVAVIMLAIMIPLFNTGTKLTLEHSEGVTVKEIKNPPGISTSDDLEIMTEKEAFQKTQDGLDMLIFEGIVEETRNIVVDYGSFKDYYAIATIAVTDSILGEVNPDESVDVLLPGPIYGKFKHRPGESEDTTYSSQIRTGQKGIFMPVTYDETTIIDMDGHKLALLDLAPYGLMDGEQWIFLETEDGLIFNEQANPSFTKAKDLTEVKAIIQEKLQ